MACAEPRLTALKVAHKGEIHRLRVDLQAFTFEDLKALFAQTFSLSPNSFVVQYNDTEGDVLNVTSEDEYVEACRVFLSGADAVKSLRFTAVSRTQVAFQENVAEPILKAIEKLVETLKATMEKVKQEQWAQRAQSGVENTGEAIKTGVGHTGEALSRAAKDARESLEQTGEVLSRVANDARESLCAAGKSIQEIPFDKVLKDTGDNLKAAAEHIGAFANEVVDELRKLPATPIVPGVPTAPVAPADLSHPVEPTPAEVVQPAEPGWEQVEEQTQPASPVEETPVVVVAEPEIVEVVSAPAPSADELKWAAQIATIRDIFPEVDVQHVIERLEQCNGNVEVVLNALIG
uniref:PB1 domain-containing protein n=1 Tax=Arabidopsis thaliana TaxID=3702 RepID=Q8GUI7_ARATH|nr:Unknown protein [Arabidopsis thaliana]